jgi:hypothetical protein
VGSWILSEFLASDDFSIVPAIPAIRRDEDDDSTNSYYGREGQPEIVICFRTSEADPLFRV